MSLAAILGLATAFCQLLKVLVEKLLPEHKVSKFGKTVKKVVTVPSTWTQKKINDWGEKKGLNF